MRDDGIDVSRHQGRINWPQVAASGITWAYCKASEGVGYTDPTYAENVDGARRAGIRVGAYHYCRPSGPYPATDAAREVSWFADQHPHPGALDLTPALDIEETDLDRKDTARWLTVAVENLRERGPARPVVYCSPGWFNAAVEAYRWQNVADLWVAHWTGEDRPTLPNGWDRWIFWQYTSLGRVDGVSGRVDRNRRKGLDVLVFYGLHVERWVAAWLAETHGGLATVHQRAVDDALGENARVVAVGQPAAARFPEAERIVGQDRWDTLRLARRWRP